MSLRVAHIIVTERMRGVNYKNPTPFCVAGLKQTAGDVSESKQSPHLAGTDRFSDRLNAIGRV